MPSISSWKISPRVSDKIIYPFSPNPREVDIIPVSSLDFTDGETEAVNSFTVSTPKETPETRKFLDCLEAEFPCSPLLPAMPLCLGVSGLRIRIGVPPLHNEARQGSVWEVQHTHTHKPTAHSHTQSFMHPLQVLSRAPASPCSAWGRTAPGW